MLQCSRGRFKCCTDSYDKYSEYPHRGYRAPLSFSNQPLPGAFTVTWQGPKGDTTLAATFEASSGAIDATAPVTVTIVGPVSTIKVVEASTTSVITWDVVVSAYKS